MFISVRPEFWGFFYKCSNQENILVLVLGTNCRMQQVKQQTVYDNNPELYQNINKENIPIANLIFFFIYNLY